jgi:hypothetical protein
MFDCGSSKTDLILERDGIESGLTVDFGTIEVNGSAKTGVATDEPISNFDTGCPQTVREGTPEHRYLAGDCGIIESESTACP